MYKSDASFVLRSYKFTLKGIDGSLEIYEMSEYNLRSEIYSDYGLYRQTVCTVKIFHKDTPDNFTISYSVSDLVDEINKYPVFISIR
jgi:hypothetical protein